MSNLEMLEIYKADAMEQLAENERVIEAQKARIADLEYHLGRVRDQAYLIITATVGVVPMVYVPDAPGEAGESPKKARKVKT